ncbi:hypothetical protein MYMA111404_03990 [Mycoplasma marinum]|nr:hypothetical protein [Mycoplasma marinum]
MGVAFLGGIFTITPGGSGAIIQLLFKGDESGYQMYQTIHWKIMANFYAGNGANFLGLVIFALSTMAGMITMVFLFSWLFKRHKRTFAAMAFGMMFASSFALLVIPHDNLWANLSSDSSVNYVGHRIGIAISIVLAIICSAILNALTKHKENNRINKRKGLEEVKLRKAFTNWVKLIVTLKYWKYKISNIFTKTKKPFTKEYIQEVKLLNGKNANITDKKDIIKETNTIKKD